MIDKLEKLLSKKHKAGKMLGDDEKKAKMDVIGCMRDMAAKAMGDKVSGLKKVTVAAPDKEGLEKGLDKAKELLDSKEAEEPKSEEMDSEESPEEEASEVEDMSMEEIDALLAKLKEAKAKKMME